MDEPPVCRTCPYFASFSADPELGFCHRYPPSTPDPGARHRPRDRSHDWPRMLDIQWCGEHPDFPGWLHGKRHEDEDSPSITMIDTVAPFAGYRVPADDLFGRR